jgi:predicted transcriptional regulator
MIIDLSERKNMEIENMTDKQFDVLMNSIIQIVKDSETKEEAVEKLQNLIDKK